MSNEEMIKAFEHFVSKKGEGVISYCEDGSMIRLQDIVDLIHVLQSENDRFRDMEFAQEYCNLYAENEWLKDILSQYMNGEIVNENIFSQQVEDMREVIKYTAKEILDEIDDNDILVIETQEYGEIEVVPMERLKEIIKSKGVEVE